MNPSAPRSPSAAQRPEPRPATASPSEDAFHVPPIAEDDDGPDVTAQPGAEAGHYGMGYGDPTRHQGGAWPQEGTPLPPSATSAGGTAPTEDKGRGQQ